MPELPEVETVKNGLKRLLGSREVIASVKTSKKSLRFPYPRSLKGKLVRQEMTDVRRRAKYLLFDLGEMILVNHLGMTGNWRESDDFDPANHDHFLVKFCSGKSLIYNDVRRFGYFDLIRKEQFASTKWFSHLGPEPLGDWSLDEFHMALKKRNSGVKSVIMNQEVVVGVGNIYASEALFLAGIRPKTKSSRLSKAKAAKLQEAMREVLASAITAGGSTIKDFKSAGGSSGYFQTQFNVYGRAGELCKVCSTPIRSETISGRNTFWCPQCQS